MAYSMIILDRAEGIATLTFNRPERLNSIIEPMAAELIDALDQIGKDDAVRVLIITGAGRAFSAGGDIRDAFLKRIEDIKRGEEGFDIATWLTKACLQLRNIPQPIIASINGPAVGLGVTLSLQCDIRIASEEATFSLPFVRVGVIPEFGSTYALPRLIGIAKACELVFTGKTITAKEAKEIGLVNEVVPASELKATTMKLAKTIADEPSLAIQTAKKILYQGLDRDIQKQLRSEDQMLRLVASSEDHEEGVRAFLEKRRPNYKR